MKNHTLSFTTRLWDVVQYTSKAWRAKNYSHTQIHTLKDTNECCKTYKN